MATIMDVDVPNRSLAKRWGNHESLLQGGWVGVPVAFLANYGTLMQFGGLTAAEAMFVLQLMAFKWSEEAPFPSYTTLAKRMGITDKQVRRYAKALEDKGFLIRTPRIGSSNSFDLQPLFNALANALTATKRPTIVKKAA
jgi:hypothetical protein